ncbi:NUDIX hydrolase [Sulfitobacter pacificus]|uniref:NUDIX domain-containing protein n=1 Tax=Sulfitobacter pacificus TaxID=1499314 RepID=A0ABQ5VNI3_9RHOB|nr:NUDIX hydrolase [Sulfitobacter pacificus]GLQ28727.1 NUDIX domain-containing protein [Sulfitobacter pacificus]
MNTEDDAGFKGAKLALFLGQQLVVILRDEKPNLSFPGHWDLPGGGREGEETPFKCVQRECFEELGLTVLRENIRWARRFGQAGTDVSVWFFVGRLPFDAVKDIRFGDEGQEWRMMEVREFLNHPKGIPEFQDRLRIYLREREETAGQEKPPLP